MKKYISFILTFIFVFALHIKATFAISAQSAITVNAVTGNVIYEKNADAKLPPASTTKIMTAIIAIEEADPEKVCTVSERAANEGGSQLGLIKGEKIKMKDLLSMLMLRSANDAAVVIAENVAGSSEKFAEKMNEKAAALGLTSTHFVNPNGMPADGHYTTARELAKIAVYALDNTAFRNLVSSKSRHLEYGNITITNSNRLLSSYDGAIGVKTGFTKAAGRCLVSAAERDGTVLVNVTLNDPNDWRDHAAMFDLGFSVSSRYVLYKQGEYTIRRDALNGDGQIIFANAETIYAYSCAGKTVEPKITENLLPCYFAPYEKGTKGGELVLDYGGSVQKIELYAVNDVGELEEEKSGTERFIYYLSQLAIMKILVYNVSCD